MYGQNPAVLRHLFHNVRHTASINSPYWRQGMNTSLGRSDISREDFDTRETCGDQLTKPIYGVRSIFTRIYTMRRVISVRVSLPGFQKVVNTCNQISFVWYGRKIHNGSSATPNRP